MPKVRKAYLPKWMAWYAQLFILPIWGFLTYIVFFTEEGRRNPGILIWLMMTLVLGAVSAMLLLMGYRKLPAYIIEEDDDQPH